MGTCIIFSGNMNTCWEHIIFVGEMCSFLGPCIIYAGNMSSCCEHVSYMLGTWNMSYCWEHQILQNYISIC
ncbi:hypothetical protein M6B38_224650 [Iris pallida]|uniref:Uncharacterized protein n=1 Tax=Iris pallida TaxID=29817 RepID=A0AAX6DUS3_IRIPA|nr:hypothetical protein M6B38_224650 [Iris pallida]